MNERTKRGTRLRRMTVVLALGVAIGTMIMATPAAADFRQSIDHIWSHIKPKADARYLQNTITIVNSVNVTAGNFNTLQVNCPAGYQATGGGVDVNDVDSMFVTSSNPVINGTRTLSVANGTHGRATGWWAAVQNNEAITMPMKVAVICSK